MSKDQIDKAASFVLYIIGALMLFGGLAMIASGLGCAAGEFMPTFCAEEAVVSRRTFFLEVIGGLVAAWAGLKMVENKL